MKFECYHCEKIISTLDSRNGEIVISVQTGGFGQIHGWMIECEECYKRRKELEEKVTEK